MTPRATEEGKHDSLSSDDSGLARVYVSFLFVDLSPLYFSFGVFFFLSSPFQVIYIYSLRPTSAAATDERVRLMR